MTVGIVLGGMVGIGLWSIHRPRPEPRPEPPTAALDISPSRIDFGIAPSSSTVEHEPPPPPSRPFYASLFVAGATWDLPCAIRGNPVATQRCRVVSVDAGETETRARIACWFVREPDVRDPDPAINTYVMTDRGLYINDNRGAPIFTPKPIRKSLPKRWGQDEPSGLEPMRANAMIHHHGAWCRIHEVQTLDTSFGDTECISRRGIVGSSYRHDGMAQRCGDVP